jgi:hypothetical protein
MRVYLDVCCLNRPFDDQTQARIHLESEAVLIALGRLTSGDWEWVSSEAVDLEIRRTPDQGRRSRTALIARYAKINVQVDEQVVERAAELQSFGFQTFDHFT